VTTAATATPAAGGGETTRIRFHAMFLVALSVLLFVHFETFASIVRKWTDDEAFSHGFLILPISLWLAWRKRHEFRAAPLGHSTLGVLAAAIGTIGWLLGNVAGVLVVQQFAAVLMIPALFLAVFGLRATRVMLMPLGFLVFMVPFGRAIVPLLMEATAAVAGTALAWTGVPVARDHMLITIPGGWFEVARACSGLNYFVSSLVLGVLYAYIYYRGWTKRLLCIAAFVALPVVLNWVRVYLIILVSWLTDMRFGPGAEHILFGRIFFILVLLLIFWVGRRWHDDPTPTDPSLGTGPARWSAVAWIPALAATLIASAGPALATTAMSSARQALQATPPVITLPTVTEWGGPQEAPGRWRPLYKGGLLERQAVYLGGARPVDVFVAVYGLGTSMGTEMISYGNTIAAEEYGSLADDATRALELDGAGALPIRELTVPGQRGPLLVWQWYVVGSEPVVGQFKTKALETVALLTGQASSERVVVVSTPLDAEAEERLERFVRSMATCAARGFDGEGCGS
jgi:exosortase A